jgi:hypothetical protein
MWKLMPHLFALKIGFDSKWSKSTSMVARSITYTVFQSFLKIIKATTHGNPKCRK